MEKENFKELCESYLQIQAQIDALNAQKDEIAASLKEFVSAQENGKFSIDGYQAKTVVSKRIKYKDETAIRNYIIGKGFSNVYLVQAIDTSKLNTELKNEGQLYTALKDFIEINKSTSLSVKKDGE